MNTRRILGEVIGIDVTRRRVKLTYRELPAIPPALLRRGARLIPAGPRD
jgi:hypothetical protein